MTVAGPVTVRKADGSVEVRPAYTPEQLRALLRGRRCAGMTAAGTRCRRTADAGGYCPTHRPD